VPWDVSAQQVTAVINKDNILSQGGVIITIVLLAIPVILAIFLLFVKLGKRLGTFDSQVRGDEAAEVAELIDKTPVEDIEAELESRKSALDYKIEENSLAGDREARDKRGVLQLDSEVAVQIVSMKKRAIPRPNVDPALSKMVIWYLISATIWLLFGTSVGEYVGIKFVAPEVDSVSWLSFGRLRPVHTNAVFWGWASLAMIGLAYYVVPRVSNTKLYSMKMGWYSLHLINLSVLVGTISLMAGINNGGGEYREYIWPIMLLFAIALVMTLINFYKTIGKRTTREIYISNWYIVSAIIFTIVIALVAYIPWWQNGLGETIVQGYYMHQGVGMWFMLFTLGLVYYFLPQQLNKPIYSYSLGILAFWSQILFYTLIGSHHFVFSSIPWWLQTVAIVGSAGMAIPVIAGTTNFLMTFNGAWYKVKDSYTLPFFLVGTIFYFTGSMQGTAEAFRSTNLFWHFTDFTVAHSHLTMYGIICFFVWACIYAIVPRFTGREAPQITIGAHFWLALIGLMFYTVPLMYGSTLKGLMWSDGKPFIESVVFTAPHWLWRAIGGSLMWLSHIFFAYNMYKMLSVERHVDIQEEIVKKLEQREGINK
jgi:cytochrome c oxidase cbb3-type subunit 1